MNESAGACKVWDALRSSCLINFSRTTSGLISSLNHAKYHFQCFYMFIIVWFVCQLFLILWPAHEEGIEAQADGDAQRRLLGCIKPLLGSHKQRRQPSRLPRISEHANDVMGQTERVRQGEGLGTRENKHLPPSDHQQVISKNAHAFWPPRASLHFLNSISDVKKKGPSWLH